VAHPDRKPVAGIYFLQGEKTKLIKIGFSRDIASRIEGFRAGSPDALILIGAIDGSLVTEKFTQDEFAGDRRQGEWFVPSPKLLTLAVSEPERTEAAQESVRLLKKRQAVSRDPNEPMPATFAARLRWWREGAGMTTREAGRAIGVGKQSIAQWEDGTCCASSRYALRIAELWGLTPSEYFAIPGALISEREQRFQARRRDAAAQEARA